MSSFTLEELQNSRRSSQIVRIPYETDVPVTRRLMRLVDSQPFQRLGDISQLGLVQRVYPGARHSRFEHCLGVYRLALIALEHLSAEPAFVEQVTDHDAKLFVLAALLHDIGHWAYCHPIEDMRLPGMQTHEQVARGLLLEGELADLIQRDWQVDPVEVAEMLSPTLSPNNSNKSHSSNGSSSSHGRTLVRHLLSGPIDIDKLDYLQRDSLHAGVPYGRNFDQRRLLGSYCVGPTGRELAITSKGKTAAEMMVFSRYVMFSEVYWHHAVRSATAMLQRMVFACRDHFESDGWIHWSDRRMNDYLSSLSQTGSQGEDLRPLSSGLFGGKRGLYKRLLEFNFVENPIAHKALARRTYAELVAIAGRLAQRLSRHLAQALKPIDVLIDAPPVKLEVQFKISVRLSDGSFQPLADVSPVVRSLATEQFDDYVKRVHVFIAPERRQDIRLTKQQLIDELLLAVEEDK